MLNQADVAMVEVLKGYEPSEAIMTDLCESVGDEDPMTQTAEKESYTVAYVDLRHLCDKKRCMYFMCKKLFKYFPQVFPTTLICSLYYHEQSAPASQERSLSHYAGDVESSHTVRSALSMLSPRSLIRKLSPRFSSMPEKRLGQGPLPALPRRRQTFGCLGWSHPERC